MSNALYLKMKLFTYILSGAIAIGGIWQLTEASQDFWSGKKSEVIGHTAAAAVAFMLVPMAASSAEDLGKSE